MAEFVNRAAAVFFFNFLIFLNWLTETKKEREHALSIGSIEHLAQMKAMLTVPQSLICEEAEKETLVAWYVLPQLPPIILKSKINITFIKIQKFDTFDSQ